MVSTRGAPPASAHHALVGRIWAIGDWLLFGERKYGEMYTQALKATGYDYGTHRNWKHVAERVGLSRRRDNLSWSHYFEVASLPPSEQETFLERAESKGWSRDKMRLAVRDHKRRKSKQVEAAQRAALLGEPSPYDCALPDGVELLSGDFRDVLAGMKAGSVNLILTDPPYGKDYVGLYGDLAMHARRLLKPGGSLVAICAQSYLPQIMRDMGQHLDYCWIFCYQTPGAPTRTWPAKTWPAKWYVFSNWKPVLWYTNGPGAPSGLHDVLETGEREKTRHQWEQPEAGFDYLVKKLTEEGDIVVDPCMGTGTVGAVALRMGRNFIGIDIDPEAVETARRRLAAIMAEEDEGVYAA